MRAAADLLDAGGPEAVTLREVGARAGVSRNAPYRHFADKEALLTAVAVKSWARLADELRAIGTGNEAPAAALKQALMTFVELGRKRPHLYQLMFVIPERDPSAGARAAADAQQELLSIVAAAVGTGTAQQYGAMLFAGAHGIAELQISGHLSKKKWGVTATELIALMVASAVDHPSARR
jgi:AcrR family transcriptional regulator